MFIVKSGLSEGRLRFWFLLSRDVPSSGKKKCALYWQMGLPKPSDLFS